MFFFFFFFLSGAKSSVPTNPIQDTPISSQWMATTSLFVSNQFTIGRIQKEILKSILRGSLIRPKWSNFCEERPAPHIHYESQLIIVHRQLNQLNKFRQESWWHIVDGENPISSKD